MTTIASEHNPEHSRGSLLQRGRISFRAWRRGRPFWGALFVILGGLEIIWIPYSPIGVVVHEGIAGVGGMFIGALMIMFGLSAAFAPGYRVFAGIASVLLSLVALPATNLGGFLLGTLCGLFGGSFAVAWTPRPGMVPDTWLQRRAKRRAAAEEDALMASEHGTAEFTADEYTASEYAGAGFRTAEFNAPDTAAPEFTAPEFNATEFNATEPTAPDTQVLDLRAGAAAEPEPEPFAHGFSAAEIAAAEAAAAESAGSAETSATPESTRTPVNPED